MLIYESSNKRTPLISVCIPAYNRAELLGELLESILDQQFDDFEVVIVEDSSPERSQIRKIVQSFAARFPQIICYYENSENLGYDANLRRLIELSRGRYVLFMGNDDVMASGALSIVAAMLNRYPKAGVLVRSYAVFEGNRNNIVQVMRYFDHTFFCPAGAQAVALAYRRSVVISGMVICRDEALKWSTDRFDGTLLYQLYLVANILCDFDVIFIPDIISLYRSGGIPDFGNARVEQNKHVPKQQTVESSLAFMRGMLEIAKYIHDNRKVFVYQLILRDIANYSLPILLIQAKKPFLQYFSYCFQLAGMGLGRFPLFYVWFLGILVLRPSGIIFLVNMVKRFWGSTPMLSKFKVRE